MSLPAIFREQVNLIISLSESLFALFSAGHIRDRVNYPNCLFSFEIHEYTEDTIYRD